MSQPVWRRRRLTLGSTLAATLATLPAISGEALAQTSRPELSRGDRRFIENAAMGGMAEVELGRMAQQRAADAQVKSFAGTMVQDHGKANEELMSLAAAKGVKLQTQLDRSHQRESDRLAKRSGADFDRDYMDHMVDDHKKDVSDFEKAAKGARDPEVKAWAAKTLPTLQAHLTSARSIQGSLKAASR